MMEKSAVVEYTWENHHPIHCEETTVLDHQELLVKETLYALMMSGTFTQNVSKLFFKLKLIIDNFLFTLFAMPIKKKTSLHLHYYVLHMLAKSDC